MCDVAQMLEDRGMAKGMAKGMAQGIAQGQEQGMDRVSKLINHLAKQGKTDEILKVTSDTEYRDQMLKALNM